MILFLHLDAHVDVGNMDSVSPRTDTKSRGGYETIIRFVHSALRTTPISYRLNES